MEDTQIQSPPISKELQELLIKEYLKNNLGASREDLFFRCKNGKIVFEQISQIFDIFDLDDLLESFPILQEHRLQDIPLDELAKDQDERYQECLLSAKNSKKILEYLANAKVRTMKAGEKNQRFHQIRRLEKECSLFSNDIVEAKRELLRLMDSEAMRITGPVVQPPVIRLLDATMGLIDSHCILLEQETELSNHFFEYTQTLIKKHFKNIKSRVTPTTVQTILKVYKFIENKGKISPFDIKQANFEMFEESMNQFQEVLSQKRDNIEQLSKLVGFLDTVLNKLTENVDENGNLPSRQTKKKKKELVGKESGMNIIGRLKDRFRFRRNQ